MNTKLDDEDVMTASNPELRHAAIVSLTKQYRKGCWGMGILLLGLSANFVFGSKPPSEGIFVILILPFMQLYRWESDLRWLQIIEKTSQMKNPWPR